MKHYSSALISSVSVVAMLATAPVLSQELDEIIVTATKREENMQQVPLAITAFSQESLNRLGANDVERLDALTPGFEWGQYGAGAKPTIRGMSSPNFEVNNDSPVGFFVDGLYLGRGFQVWTVMTDIERVEILRGPQGTLFGRNTSGGSINVITRKPSREKEFSLEVTAADYDHIGTEGYFNVPLSDNWAARLTFYTEDHDGYLENTFDPSNDQLDEQLWYVRGALRYDNGPLVVDFSVDTWDQGGNGNGFSGAKFFDPGSIAVNDWAEFLNNFLAGNAPVSVPGNSLTNDWQIALNRSYREVESTNATLTITYDFAEMTFKSISGFSSFEQIGGGDTDFHTLFLADCRLVSDVDLWTQELQLSSNTAGNLEWTVGLYYLDESSDELFRFLAPEGLQGLFDFLGVPGDFTGPQNLANRFGTATAESSAIYGQATYSINEQVRLTVGARYTSDDKTYISNDNASPDQSRATVSDADTFDEATWKVGLDYLIDDSKMLYGHISTGYRSGGFNRYLPPPPGGILEYPFQFEPETVINYEIGFKADLADNTLRMNIAAYYNEIDDLQVYAFDNTVNTSVTAVANEASTKGAELELTWLPSEPAQIQFIAAYMDAVYDDYPTWSDGFANFDVSGNKRELSPELKVTLAVSYDFDLGSAGTLTPYLQSTYKDDYFVTPGNEPLFGLDRQDSYTQTDVRLIWNSPERHWRGEVFYQNIEDNFLKVGGFVATGGYWITYGPEPALFGAKLAYTF